MLVFSLRDLVLRSRRLMVVLCTAGMVVQTAACYSLAPVQTTPPAKADRITISINDKGREMLRERVSPLVDRIEGRVVSIDSANVVMNVSRVIDLKAGATNWVGEQITVPREAILAYQDRPYSRSKTVAFVGALVIGLVLIATSISLAVSGRGLPDTPDTGSGGQS